MEIEGRIIIDLGFQSGTSKAGNPWKKREMVLETLNTQYPRKVKFHLFGDRADTIQLEVGRSYRLSVDVESREFNGRWYTDLNCYAAAESGSDTMPNYPQGGFGQPAQPAYQQPAPQNFQQPAQQPMAGAPSPFPPADTNESDDLPF